MSEYLEFVKDRENTRAILNRLVFLDDNQSLTYGVVAATRVVSNFKGCRCCLASTLGLDSAEIEGGSMT